MKIFGYIGILVVLTTLLMACANSDLMVATPVTVEHDATTDHHADEHDEGLLEITIVANDDRILRFEPDVITVVVGQRVRLTYVNDGRAEHDMEITDLPASDVVREGDHNEEPLGHHEYGVVAAHALAGTTVVVLFTPTEVGEYEFHCTVAGHQLAGMVGNLVVVKGLHES